MARDTAIGVRARVSNATPPEGPGPSDASASEANESLAASLYAESFDQLVGFLSSRFGSGPPPPEDLAQAAFERVLSANNLQREKSPKAFLWRIATNLAVSALRKNGVESRNLPQLATLFVDDEGYRLSPERVLEAKEDLDVVYRVITQMPEGRRRAFLLVRVDGLSHADAAQRMGVSRVAVSKHVARAMQDIARALNDE